MPSPTRSLFERIMTLLGADSVTMAGALVVRLIKEPFSESLDQTFTADDEADFDGYAGIDVAAATRPTANDPATGDRLLTVTPPAGGFRWETTGATNLPQTIYGYVVCDDTTALGTTTIAWMKRFSSTEEVTLTAADQEVLAGTIQQRLVVPGLQ